MIRKLIFSAALPYANGNLHLGHIIEHLQGDIWRRFHTLIGNKCIFICGIDAHGTPIMLKSLELKITIKNLILYYYRNHLEIFFKFRINHTIYYTTHSIENKLFSIYMYNTLKISKYLIKSTSKQPYDSLYKIFIPDRLIKGKCKNCHTNDQYNDSCTYCGVYNTTTDLRNPISTISNKSFVYKRLINIHVDLNKFKKFFKNWVFSTLKIQNEVYNKTKEWFSTGLKKWDISRNSPYFGFSIPNTRKYFYVWWDAPIGYVSIVEKLCKLNKKYNFSEFWSIFSFTYDLYHFIGKDISYFHILFWPVILFGNAFRLPTGIHTHGFLMIDNKKISKSNKLNTNLNYYIKNYNSEYLRFFFSLKLRNDITDINFSYETFLYSINTIFIGKYVNFISRCCHLLKNYFNNFLADTFESENLYILFTNKKDYIFYNYEIRNYVNVVEKSLFLISLLNKIFDEKKPWVLVKNINTYYKAHIVISDCLNLFKIISFYLKCVIPDTVSKIEKIYNIPKLNGLNFSQIMLNSRFNKFKTILKKMK